MITHGTDDQQVRIEASERARDLLKQAGYRVQFETFDGGHVLPPDAMRNAGEWIRSWK
jgi:predicted esterase